MKLAARIKTIEFESVVDSCTDECEEPTMTIEFLDAGGGSFVQIKDSHFMPMDADEIVPFAEFLKWVCDQNDKILEEESI